MVNFFLKKFIVITREGRFPSLNILISCVQINPNYIIQNKNTLSQHSQYHGGKAKSN